MASGNSVVRMHGVFEADLDRRRLTEAADSHVVRPEFGARVEEWDGMVNGRQLLIIRRIHDAKCSASQLANLDAEVVANADVDGAPGRGELMNSPR